MKLGDWLVSKGKISQEQLARALQNQGFFGGRLGNSLIKLGFLDENTLGEYLADASRSRYAPPERLESIPREVIAAVPARLAARYRIVPIAIRGRKLHLAMSDPKDLIALDEIAFLTGLAIEPYVATEFRIVRAIEQYYGITLGAKTIPVSGGTEQARSSAGAAAIDKAPSPPPPPAPEMGLDGLPLDADPDESDEPFISARSSVPPVEGDGEPIPASLDEWRMAQHEVPEEFPDVAAAASSTAPAAVPDVGSAASGPASEGPSAAPAHPRSGPNAAGAASQVAGSPGPVALETTAARLRGAETRDEVFSAILDFAASRFHRAALFVVQQDRVLGWSGRGEALAPLRIRNVTVPLDRPSLFVFFRDGGDYYYGPVPDLPANARFYLDMGCPPPSRILLLPLTIKERAAVILYADNGPEAGKAPDIQLFRRLLQKSALALEVLILRNKIMMI